MRLLHTPTLNIYEFMGQTPYYAILSHRWEGEEVSFQDLKAGRGPKMKGYAKIENFCKQALKDGWEYGWVDSCCIDKTSSAELSEAINSMFQWYRNSQVCYAYLSDVGALGSNEDQVDLDFSQSQWFTRGWTLQELLAPPTVIFFQRDWVDIGTRSTLRQLIQSITGISNLTWYEHASVAQKMSWAARRTTTRVEDMAYCLMGLFGINMPLLYGEGRKAFLRLQLEILKETDDESLFAWQGESDWDESGLLAPSPKQFINSGDIRKYYYYTRKEISTMTNRGLRMELPVWPGSNIGVGGILTPLNCIREKSNYPLGIYLRMDDILDVQRTRCHALVEYFKERDQVSFPEPRNYPVIVFIKQNFGFSKLQRDLDRSRQKRLSVNICSPWRHVFFRQDWFLWSKEARSNAPIFGAELVNLNLQHNEVIALLYVSQLRAEEVFIILLKRMKDFICVDVSIPDASQKISRSTLKDAVLQIFDKDLHDRISRRLPTGKSVDVSVQRGVDLLGMCYFVNVSIHEKETGDWPGCNDLLKPNEIIGGKKER